MSVSEATLIILMQNLLFKYQRVIMLEKYVCHYGSLSSEAWEKVRRLIAEAKETSDGLADKSV